MTDENLSRHEQNLWRANTYHLLARLLAAPPDHRLVAQLGEIPPLREESAEEPVAIAWSELGEASRRTREVSVHEEFRSLFDKGEVTPLGAWYLSGELKTKYLQLLRSELADLDIEKKQNGTDIAEDHAGVICEIMCLLVESDDFRQSGFFSRHLATWMGDFFGNLRQAPSADFYRPVGALGEAFLEIERIYLRKFY